jgi:hypothetical protein
MTFFRILTSQGHWELCPGEDIYARDQRLRSCMRMLMKTSSNGEKLFYTKSNLNSSKERIFSRLIFVIIWMEKR